MRKDKRCILPGHIAASTSLASHSLCVRGIFHIPTGWCPSPPARETVALLAAETPDFISPQQWPPNIPDLNPVDYAIWGVLQERVYRCAIRDVSHLKERLVEELHRFDQKSIDASVSQ